jgi:predicted ester cyclase
MSGIKMELDSQVERNKRLVRRFVDEVWNEGALHVAEEVLAEGYIEHPSSPDEEKPTEPCGPEGMKRFVGMFRHAFPDMKFTIEHMLAEGDRVAIHLVGRGTHLGDLHGMAPTGRPVVIGGAAIHRIENDKIAETYQVVDRLRLREQIGAPQMGDIDVG